MRTSHRSLRKAYIQILFSPHVSSSANPLAPTASATGVKSHNARMLDVINLLWLETSHALIQVYRAKVVEMDKAIAEAPAGHRGGARGVGGGNRGANPTTATNGGSGGRGNSAPGPTARRRLIHSFRTFLGAEEEFFGGMLSKLSGSLYSTDLAGLRSLGINVSMDEGDEGELTLSAEEKKTQRERAVPLAHKALICFGDLARYRELYNEPGAGIPNPGAVNKPEAESNKKGRGRENSGGRKTEGERKVKNWSRAAECYHQARLLIPDNGSSLLFASVTHSKQVD